MAVNDRFMLPRRVRTMEQMADLLQVEQTELTQLQHIIMVLESQLNVSTSSFLLSRHEKIFGLQVNAEESIEVRRSRVLAKLRGQGTTTIKMIKNVAESFTNGQVDVIEHTGIYRFDIKFTGTIGVPPNLDDLSTAIQEIKPAHLVFGYIFIYRTHKQLGGYTHAQLAAYTHEQLRNEVLT